MILLYSENFVFERDVWSVKQYPTFNDYTLLRIHRKKGFEEIGKKNTSLKLVSDLDFLADESLRCSLSRTKSSIRDIALCNNFDFFYTQTFSAEYRYDFEKVVSEYKKSLKAYKRKYKDFKFLVIYEKHNDGAIHLHGLLKGLGDDLYINNYGYFSIKHFEKLGFCSLSKIRDYEKCCNYITKYISKDFLKTSKNQIYFCSKGLDKPIKKYYSYNEINIQDLKLVYQNDYVKKFKE